MTTFTIILLLVVLTAVAWGWMQGIVRQIGSLAGVILGIVVARIWGDNVAAWLIAGNPQANTVLLTVVAYLGVFVLVYLGARLVAYCFHKLLKVVKLTLLDRVLGALFKLVEWLFVFSLLVNLWVAIAPSYAPHGVWAEYVQNMAPSILGADSAQDLLDAVKI